MSTKSKTGDKLVASVRKSKTGTVAKKTSERPDAGKPAAKPKQTAARSASKTTASKPVSKAATNEDRRNFFSHGCRVWPD